MKKLAWFLLIIIGFLFIYGIYNRSLTVKNGVQTNAVVTKTIGQRMGRYENEWELLYLVNNKPYFASITEPEIQKGDIYELIYNKNEPTKHIVKQKTKYNSYLGKVIIYASKMSKEINRIKVYPLDNKRYKLLDFKFNESFGFVLNSQNGYIFNFYNNSHLIYSRSFSILEMKNSTTFICLDNISL